MPNPLPSLLAGVVFGLALAAPPGPMNAVIAEESVTNGWLAGARTGLGAMTADAVFFVGALLGVVTFVERFPTLRAAMVGVGGVLMLYFAYGAAMDAVGDVDAVPTSTDSAAARAATGFRKAFVLALTNPYQILFWLTIGVGLLEPGQLDVLSYTPYVGADLAGLLVVRTGSPALIAGFFLGITLWITGFPAALRAAQRRVARFAPVVAGASALVLGGFGVVFLVDAVRTLA
ncbi:LysE family translocator [Haloplanus aerogenes]|uniref:LysE family translocator n=2 Tax=Haloplanus aerogenes TaxID=660522 RepID=A0A3M0D360_9EURY|nr:LysE family translocator [Haloplanus aerogenes]AZH25071.1 LysE family translocator [Haloplanus aerogenes]RMB13709.1 threonine/homoserine/homoserine lactone efflux protein [Haloplanus aerogenes]